MSAIRFNHGFNMFYIISNHMYNAKLPLVVSGFQSVKHRNLCLNVILTHSKITHDHLSCLFLTIRKSFFIFSYPYIGNTG